MDFTLSTYSTWIYPFKTPLYDKVKRQRSQTLPVAPVNGWASLSSSLHLSLESFSGFRELATFVRKLEGCRGISEIEAFKWRWVCILLLFLLLAVTNLEMDFCWVFNYLMEMERLWDLGNWVVFYWWVKGRIGFAEIFVLILLRNVGF